MESAKALKINEGYMVALCTHGFLDVSMFALENGGLDIICRWSPEIRFAERQERSKPIIDAVETCPTSHLAHVSAKSPLGKALKYIAEYWDGYLS